MNEGWLCDSILKAQAHPSPMSIMPAFSPGPCTTSLLRVGSRLRWTRDDLYEQCSLHMTLKMPSSVSEGSRPSALLIFSYSSGVIPWSSMTARVRAEAWAVDMVETLFSHVPGGCAKPPTKGDRPRNRKKKRKYKSSGCRIRNGL